MSKQNGTRLTNDKGLTRIAFDELKKKKAQQIFEDAETVM